MYAKPNDLAQFQPACLDTQVLSLEILRLRIAADIATIRLTDLLGLHPHNCAEFLKAAAFANTLNIALNNDAFLAELGLASGTGCALEIDDLAARSVKQFPDAAKLFLKLNTVPVSNAFGSGKE